MKKEDDKFKVTTGLTIRGTSIEVVLDCAFEGVGRIRGATVQEA